VNVYEKEKVRVSNKLSCKIKHEFHFLPSFPSTHIERQFVLGSFYGAVRKLTFLEKLFCLPNSIIVHVMLSSILLVEQSMTKLYLITNQSSYKILRGISILVHKWKSMCWRRKSVWRRMRWFFRIFIILYVS